VDCFIQAAIGEVPDPPFDAENRTGDTMSDKKRQKTDKNNEASDYRPGITMHQKEGLCRFGPRIKRKIKGEHQDVGRKYSGENNEGMDYQHHHHQDDVSGLQVLVDEILSAGKLCHGIILSASRYVGAAEIKG
jgi:hypothetical protein